MTVGNGPEGRARVERLGVAWRDAAKELERDDLPLESMQVLAASTLEIYSLLCVKILMAGGEIPSVGDDDDDEDDEDEDPDA